MLLFENFESDAIILKKLIKRTGKEFTDIHEAEYFLESEYNIYVNDGIVEFYELSDIIIQIIGELPVKLYHFAPKKYKKDILRDGLIKNRVKTNPFGNSYSGVYLTTKTSGPEIDGYKYHIRNAHNSDVIMIELKMYLSELQPDPDDYDMSSGSTQFISDNINSDRIITIEDVI